MFQNCESLIKQCSESDTAVHKQDVFDFFKPTENSLKFKNFLTPTTESNMLKYIAIKSNESITKVVFGNESITKVVFGIFSKMIILGFLTIPWLGPKDTKQHAPLVPKANLGHRDSKGYWVLIFRKLSYPK